FVSEDGLSLFFGSNQQNRSVGETEIFVSSRSSVSENFGDPVLLGDGINSGDRELDPHLAPDGLYFSSTRSGGEGRTDIWFAPFAPIPEVSSFAYLAISLLLFFGGIDRNRAG
ncbi:MAG: hypothetical protein AAGJ79_12835, partial [Verrucomicrobiota bacterium]